MKRILLALSLFGTAALSQAQTDNYPNGSTVPNFTVTDIDGVSHTLYDYTSQGKYVVLDFFFVDCYYCQQTAPYLSQLHETYGCNSADLICLTINNGDDNSAAVAGYESTYGGTYHHCPAVSNQGGGGAVNSTFGVSAFPTYCLISPSNVMIAHDMYPISSMSDFVAYFPTGNVIQPAACATGIAEQNSTVGLSLHPSPSNGRFTVDVNGMGAGEVTMQVFDMLGQQLRSIPVGATLSGMMTREVDLSDLDDGQYLCQFITPDGRKSIRRTIIAH